MKRINNNLLWKYTGKDFKKPILGLFSKLPVSEHIAKYEVVSSPELILDKSVGHALVCFYNDPFTFVMSDDDGLRLYRASMIRLYGCDTVFLLHALLNVECILYKLNVGPLGGWFEVPIGYIYNRFGIDVRNLLDGTRELDFLKYYCYNKNIYCRLYHYKILGMLAINKIIPPEQLLTGNNSRYVDNYIDAYCWYIAYIIESKSQLEVDMTKIPDALRTLIDERLWLIRRV